MLVQVPPSFPEAIHLVSSDSAAGQVKFCGGRRGQIHYAMDRLTIGPCDPDPERHLELRRAWHAEEDWMPLLGHEHLRAATAGVRPVVLWATRAYADLVWLWWAMDGLHRIAVDLERVYLARPSPDDPLQTVGGSTADEARPALAAATPVLDNDLREGAELWMQYATPSPVAFDEARRRGSSVFPELSTSAELHGAWFPRLSGGRLRLSEHDEVLLGSVGDAWGHAFDRLDPEGSERVARLVRPIDDLFLIKRLREWAARGALEREAVPSDDNPYEEDLFRRNDTTRRLLEHGIEGIADAPPLYVGGCHVNDPTMPWVRIVDAAGWRLALHGRP